MRFFVMGIGVLAIAVCASAKPTPYVKLRAEAEFLLEEGHLKEAYEKYAAYMFEKDVPGPEVVADLDHLVQCMVPRGYNSIAFLDKMAKAHADKWDVLADVGRRFTPDEKDDAYGGAELYRLKAMQHYDAALNLSIQNGSEKELAEVMLGYAGAISSLRLDIESTRMLLLTDLTSMETDPKNMGYSRRPPKPKYLQDALIFIPVPETFAAATNDWQRWRYLLKKAGVFDPDKKNAAAMQAADYIFSVYGTHTIDYNVNQLSDDDPDDVEWLNKMSQLGDNKVLVETLPGQMVLELPDDLAFFRLYRENNAWSKMAQVYLGRGLVKDAVRCLHEAIKQNPEDLGLEELLNGIVGNRFYLEDTDTQTAGRKATLEIEFANGQKIDFRAYSVDPDMIFQKEDWSGLRGRIEQWAEDLEEGTVSADPVASWSVKLDPGDRYESKWLDIETPLTEAGLYLIRVSMEGADYPECVVLRMSDLAVVSVLKGPKKRPLPLLYVSDPESGAPIADAKVELWVNCSEKIKKVRADGSSKWETKMHQRSYERRTDKDGLVFFSDAVEWMGKYDNYDCFYKVESDDGKVGWYTISNDNLEKKSHPWKRDGGKVFVTTDRKNYRPGQTVNYAGWLRQCDKDRKQLSDYADKKLTVEIRIRREMYQEQQVELDRFGRFSGQLVLPEDAKLGRYTIKVSSFDKNFKIKSNSEQFHVEEYKKPEFTVQIDVPKEAGPDGALECTVSAAYQFGSPVQHADVAVQVDLQADGHDTDFFWSGLVLETNIQTDASGMARFVIPAHDFDERYWLDYDISASVTDEARREIRKHADRRIAGDSFWSLDWDSCRGFYRAGEPIDVTLKAAWWSDKPLKGSADVSLQRIEYDAQGNEELKTVDHSSCALIEDGPAAIKLVAHEPGEYRVLCLAVTEDGYEKEDTFDLMVMGDGYEGRPGGFDDFQVILEKTEYQPGETAQIMITTLRENVPVWMAYRHNNGVHSQPTMLNMKGSAMLVPVPVEEYNTPSFDVLFFSVHDGKIHEDSVDVWMPMQKYALNTALKTDKQEYLPGDEVELQLAVRDSTGEPREVSGIVTVYDASLDELRGRWNSLEDFQQNFWRWPKYFWWRNRDFLGGNLRCTYVPFWPVEIADDPSSIAYLTGGFIEMGGSSASMTSGGSAAAPMLRSNLRDAAYWNASVRTDTNGVATMKFDMPDNIGKWNMKAWVMGDNLMTGYAETNAVTSKNLLLRMQGPRFFVEGDEVTLSANVHNELESDKEITAVLELDGTSLELLEPASKKIMVKAHNSGRVDWTVRALKEGSCTIRMKALTNEESDAMQKDYPVLVHGIEKVVSFSGHLLPAEHEAAINLEIPEKRRPKETELTIRWSPTLAGAMIDALPYLANYPYGCTEQTLNRFLPSVLTRKTLQEMGLDLTALRSARANLNAQEIGDPSERAKQWKKHKCNPAYDEEGLNAMVDEGLDKLYSMQCSDGGWGWFSGSGEKSSGHTTAYVVHGLQKALESDLAVDPDVLKRGIDWLKRYQEKKLKRIQNEKYKKAHPDDLDAFMFMVLVDGDEVNHSMQELLYEERPRLSAYGLACLGLAFDELAELDQLYMLIRNIEQYLVEDAENQTAYLKLRNDSCWWYWYGDEIETMAYYLKLLSRTDPKSEKAAGLVKYLLNNRKHATYWKSTRDTAICVEAMAEYLAASGETQPDMTVEVLIDGKVKQKTHVTAENLFSLENTLTLEGEALSSGKHEVTFRKQGSGPLYCNAYLSCFSLEDFIEKTGLEVKVQRKYYKIIDNKRVPIANLGEVTSGDLIEVELELESKNDYEYLLVTDPKPAGFEPVEVRSGYGGKGLRAYIEYRDEKVCFFIQRLARGKHRTAYRMRAEIPGTFSALPAQISAMYAPELRGNSDEWKVNIRD